MQGDWSAQDTRQQGAQSSQRDEAAPIFEEKASGQIYVASLHPGARLSRGELCVHVVVAETPARGLGFGADFAERLKEFEQAYVVVTFALHERERVVGYYRVNG